jgi:hypothetical protein
MHSRRGAAQVERQAPAMHAWPAGQLLPHIPQLALSVMVSAQEATPIAVQRVCPEGHAGGWQTPIAQVSPAAQAVPQAPQLAVLVARSKHIGAGAVGAQSVCPVGHIRGATQAPAVHDWPAGQALSQRPQWLLSVLVLTQPPPQSVWPVMQVIAGAHIPARHTSVAEHARSHIPQCSGLVCVSTQPPPQTISPGLHIGATSGGGAASGGGATSFGASGAASSGASGGAT